MQHFNNIEKPQGINHQMLKESTLPHLTHHIDLTLINKEKDTIVDIIRKNHDYKLKCVDILYFTKQSYAAICNLCENIFLSITINKTQSALINIEAANKQLNNLSKWFDLAAAKISNNKYKVTDQMDPIVKTLLLAKISVRHKLKNNKFKTIAQKKRPLYILVQIVIETHKYLHHLNASKLQLLYGISSNKKVDKMVCILPEIINLYKAFNKLVYTVQHVLRNKCVNTYRQTKLQFSQIMSFTNIIIAEIMLSVNCRLEKNCFGRDGILQRLINATAYNAGENNMICHFFAALIYLKELTQMKLHKNLKKYMKQINAINFNLHNGCNFKRAISKEDMLTKLLLSIALYSKVLVKTKSILQQYINNNKPKHLPLLQKYKKLCEGIIQYLNFATKQVEQSAISNREKKQFEHILEELKNKYSQRKKELIKNIKEMKRHKKKRQQTQKCEQKKIKLFNLERKQKEEEEEEELAQMNISKGTLSLAEESNKNYHPPTVNLDYIIKTSRKTKIKKPKTSKYKKITPTNVNHTQNLKKSNNGIFYKIGQPFISGDSIGYRAFFDKKLLSSKDAKICKHFKRRVLPNCQFVPKYNRSGAKFAKKRELKKYNLTQHVEKRNIKLKTLATNHARYRLFAYEVDNKHTHFNENYQTYEIYACVKK